MASSKINKDSVVVNNGGYFEAGITEVTITDEIVTLENGSLPTNVLIKFTLSAGISAWSKLVKPKSGVGWTSTDYTFNSNSFAYNHHNTRGTGIQNQNHLDAGDYVIVFPYA